MKFDIVEWMAKQGHVSYRNRIRDIHERMDLMKAEAGRYWQYCEFTMHLLECMQKDIEEVEREAEDRYMDWATD